MRKNKVPISKIKADLAEKGYGVIDSDNIQYDYVVTIHTENGSTQPLYLSEKGLIQLWEGKI